MGAELRTCCQVCAQRKCFGAALHVTMGKTKPFINKKTATTFTLTYGGLDEALLGASDAGSVYRGAGASCYGDAASAYGSEAG